MLIQRPNRTPRADQGSRLHQAVEGISSRLCLANMGNAKIIIPARILSEHDYHDTRIEEQTIRIHHKGMHDLDNPIKLVPNLRLLIAIISLTSSIWTVAPVESFMGGTLHFALQKRPSVLHSHRAGTHVGTVPNSTKHRR